MPATHPPADPYSARSRKRRLEARTVVPVGIIRPCPRCGNEYQPEHRTAYLCMSCWQIMRWKPYRDRLECLI